MAAMRWISALILLSALLSDSTAGRAKAQSLLAWNATLGVIALSAQTQVHLYDARTQALLAVLGNGSAALTALAWQPEGALLATGDADGRLCLWSAVHFTQECSKADSAAIRAVAWHANGTALASAADDRVRVWQVEPLSVSFAWSAEGVVTALAWRADDLAVGGAVRGAYEQGFLAIHHASGALKQRYAAELRPPSALQRVADQIGVVTLFEVFTWQPTAQRYSPLYLPLSESEAVRRAVWHMDGSQVLVLLARRLLCFTDSVSYGEIVLTAPIAALDWNAQAQTAALVTEDGSLRFVSTARCR
jgi:hypothetical protein